MSGVLAPALALLAVVALARCGVVEEPTSFATASALAERIGCTGYEAGTSGEQLATETGSCQLDGTDVFLHVFSTDDRRDQWLDGATADGSPGTFVEGDRWAARAMTVAAAEKTAEAANGDVRW